MISDRELLELAAKAGGVDGFYVERLMGNGIAVARMSASIWNSLEDDGTALRLAADLGICIGAYESSAIASFEESDLLFQVPFEGNGKYKAMRRAITMAAAEKGRAMP